MDRNVGHFDPENAERLCQIARKYGLGFKEHNADYLPMDILEMHPGLGITSANVAPEYGVVETKELINLSKQEEKAIKDRPDLKPSNFAALIRNAALECGRWKKWLVKEDVHLTEKDIAENSAKLEEVAGVCGHYVFNRDDVRAARAKLYHNLTAMKITDSPTTELVNAVRESIMKYVDAFNLRGLNSHLL